MKEGEHFRKETTRKAVNVPANKYCFCVISIQNPFVKPELINTIDPEIQRNEVSYMQYFDKNNLAQQGYF